MPENQIEIEPECRLLALPAELRNRIYDFLVLSDLQAFADLMVKPALLKASSQLGNEYSSVFFGSELLKFDAYVGEAGVWHQIQNKQSKRLIFETCVFTDILDFWSVASARRYCQRLYSDWQGNVRTGIMTIQTRSGIRRWQWSVACAD
jgi:hypothetical protein